MKELEMRALIGEEIERKLEALQELNPGSVEHQRLSTDIAKLIERFNESVKNEGDHELKKLQIDEEKAKAEQDRKDRFSEAAAQRKHEERLEKERNKFRISSLVVPVTTTLLSSGLFIWAYDRAQNKNLKFEETGRFCSDTGSDFKLPRLDNLLKMRR